MSEKKRSKSNIYCCVPQCKTYYSDNVSFHKFPKSDKTLRSQWIHALKIGKTVSPYMRVCNKHFRDEDFYFNRRHVNKIYRLKPKSVPSQNLPKGLHEKKVNDKLTLERLLRIEHRQRIKSEITIPTQTENDDLVPEIMDNVPHSKNEVEAAETLIALATSDLEKCNLGKGTEVKEFEDKAVQVNTFEEFNSFDVSDIINTDYKLRILTGIHNLALLNVLVSVLAQSMKLRSKLNMKKLILLSLMRLKLDIPFTSLSILFNISHTTAQTYFQKIITHLSVCLKNIIRFPSKDEIACNMPLCFHKFANTRIVLDCTEVEIQKSKCLKCRVRSYSYYKGRHTIKFLIGAAPSGLITFLSKAYGGRASDKAIFNKEQLISKLSRGDAIMVDKGFLIDKECASNGIELYRPPFLKNKKQFTKLEALKTAEIARARVHVERAIQRIKLFRICRNVLPFKMLKYINHIVTVIVALTNLSKPILSIDKFNV